MSEENPQPISPTPTSAMRVQMQRQRGRRRRVGIGVALLLLILTLWRSWLLFTPPTHQHIAIKVEIPSGAGLGEIAERLEEERIIRSRYAFLGYVKWRGAGKGLKAGEYLLSPDMHLSRIVRILKSGVSDEGDARAKITVPEGYTLSQLADVLATAGIVSKSKFLDASTSKTTLQRLHAAFPLPSTTLEGYLFPDTYFFGRNITPEKVIETMLLNFTAKFYRPYQQEITTQEASKNNRNLYTLVTIASLIEREAKIPKDRARIAGVLYNRLEKRMKLEVDATVLYALGRHKSHVTFADLKVNSPYNTYRVSGLPPGPIANPGLASLVAALLPENHDYLYYVALPNGSHIFSRTRAEHEAAIRERVRQLHP